MYVCMYVCILARHVRSKRTVDGEGGSSERCLKWGGEGWNFIKRSFQKHLKTRGG